MFFSVKGLEFFRVEGSLGFRVCGSLGIVVPQSAGPWSVGFRVVRGKGVLFELGVLEG